MKNPKQILLKIFGGREVGVHLMRVLLLILLFNAQVTEAARHVLLVDNSGSVAGFYETNTMQDLADELIKAIGAPHKIFLFSEVMTEVTGGIYSSQFRRNTDPKTNDTLIGKAFNTVVERKDGDIVWLVTDNVQDDSKTTGVVGNTGAFYERLKNNDVLRIHIFPCFLNFRGPLVDAPGNPLHSGLKGLLVYAILLNSTAEAEFKQKVEDFAQRATRFDSKSLFCKPLDQDTVNRTLLSEDDVRKQYANQPNYKPPNIKGGANGFYASGFKASQPIEGVFYVNFQSKFEDLKIDAKLEPNPTAFEAIGFQETTVTPSIRPQRLTLNPQEESAAPYSINVQLPKVNLKKDHLPSLLYMAFHRTGSLKGNVKIDAVVPRENFKFRDAVLDKYHTEDISHPQKIYKMGTLVEQMSTKEIRIPVVDEPIEFAVEYPWWPLALFLLAVAVFIALVVALFLGLMQEERLTVDSKPTSISLFRPYTIKANNRPAARLSKELFGGVQAKPSKGFRVNGKTKPQPLRRDSTLSVTDDQDNLIQSVDVKPRHHTETSDGVDPVWGNERRRGGSRRRGRTGRTSPDDY